MDRLVEVQVNKKRRISFGFKKCVASFSSRVSIEGFFNCSTLACCRAVPMLKSSVDVEHLSELVL